MAWLKILSGAQEGQTFRLTEAPMTVGRAPTNPIQILDESVSRRHVAFRWVGRTHTLTDLNSDNGTVVNGNRIQDALLRHGDRIVMGQIEAIYESAPGIEYPVDHARDVKDARSQMARGETKGVSVEDVRSMLAHDDAEGTVPGRPIFDPDGPQPRGGAAPLPGRAPAAAAGPSPEELRARQREQIVQVLRHKVAEGVDAIRLTDLVVTGLARGLSPDRGAVLLKQGRQEVLKPVKTWQRPEITPETPLPPLLRDIVLETVRTRRPLAVPTGMVLQTAGSVPRQSSFAALCAPVICRGTLVGAIYADNAVRPGVDFTTDDLRFTLDLASILAPLVG